MEVGLASDASPGAAVNEDHVVVAPDLVAVLDGVTAPAGLDTGCLHGPAWYVRRLGVRLLEAHAEQNAAPLPDVLAAAIDAARGDHGSTCDLDHPGSPQSTVCLLRARQDSADYLVLSDSPLVLDQGTTKVIRDLRPHETSQRVREAALVGTDAFGSANREWRVRQLVESQRRWINHPSGYWIAAANPDAAHHAVTGSVPLSGPCRLRRAALLTDGASSAVETFRLLDWPRLLDVLDEHGPAHLLAMVRAAERADPDGQLHPRYKRHDDATAAYLRFR